MNLYPIIQNLNYSTQTFLVKFVIISLIILAWSVLKNKNNITSTFRKIKKQTWIILVIIIILGLSLKIVLPEHHHRMYVDEPWTLEKAKDILKSDFPNNKFYPEPIGWSFIVSGVFVLFGLNNWIAIYFTTFIGSLITVNIFLLSYLLFKSEKAALISAGIFILEPLTMLWSASSYALVPSVFLITFSMICLLLYLKYKDDKTFILAAASLFFSMQFRGENYALLIFVGLVLIWNFFQENNLNITKKQIIIFILLGILVIPNLFEVSSFYFTDKLAIDDTHGQVDKTWSFQRIFSEEKINVVKEFMFQNSYYPIAINILFFAGIILSFRKFKFQNYFLLSWFFIFIIIFSAFFVFRKRFFLIVMPVIFLYAGYAISRIIDDISQKKLGQISPKTINVTIMIIIILSFLPYLMDLPKNSFWIDSKLESKVPEMLEKDIKLMNVECVIVMQSPTIMRATTELEVISTRDFCQGNYQTESDCLLFYEGLFPDKTLRGSSCINQKRYYSLSDFLTYTVKKGEETREYFVKKIN